MLVREVGGELVASSFSEEPFHRAYQELALFVDGHLINCSVPLSSPAPSSFFLHITFAIQFASKPQVVLVPFLAAIFLLAKLAPVVAGSCSAASPLLCLPSDVPLVISEYPAALTLLLT